MEWSGRFTPESGSGLAAHGRRGGVPMKRSERRWPEKNAPVFPY
jgi:hypothetical protein